MERSKLAEELPTQSGNRGSTSSTYRLETVDRISGHDLRKPGLTFRQVSEFRSKYSVLNGTKPDNELLGGLRAPMSEPWGLSKCTQIKVQ